MLHLTNLTFELPFSCKKNHIEYKLLLPMIKSNKSTVIFLIMSLIVRFNGLFLVTAKIYNIPHP
jgi:hypothetical protein